HAAYGGGDRAARFAFHGPGAPLAIYRRLVWRPADLTYGHIAGLPVVWRRAAADPGASRRPRTGFAPLTKVTGALRLSRPVPRRRDAYRGFDDKTTAAHRSERPVCPSPGCGSTPGTRPRGPGPAR